MVAAWLHCHSSTGCEPAKMHPIDRCSGQNSGEIKLLGLSAEAVDALFSRTRSAPGGLSNRLGRAYKPRAAQLSLGLPA